MKKMSVFLTAIAAMSLLATTASAAPSIKEVKENGKTRLDVVDRPWNGTVDYSQTIKPTKLVVAPGAIMPNTTYTKPSSIRVGIRANNSTSNPISSVSVVPWYDYNIDVLPNEWIGSWPDQSLRAGAMAIKMYAWYHILYPKYSNCDVDNTVNSQVYKPNSRYSKSTTAVDEQSGIGMTHNGVIFEAQYRAGSYDSSIPGTYIASQNGTHYWADNGKTWDWMLSYYYPGEALFNY
jgi:peptidoglycan hydrolase-like amidase